MSRSSTVVIGWVVAFSIALVSWYTPFLTPSLYDGARLFELAILTLLGLVYLLDPNLRNAIYALLLAIPTRDRLSLATLILLAGASAFHSRLVSLAWTEITLFFLLLLFALICATLASNNKQFIDRIFVASIAASTLLFAMHFVLAYSAALNAGSTFDWVTPFVTFANIRHFSQFQAYTLPLAVLPMLVFNLPSRWRIASLLLASLWWSLNFSAGSRSVWVALAFMTLAISVFIGKKALPWLRIQGMALLLGALIYLVFALATNDFGQNRSYGLASIIARGVSGSGRTELWLAAWEMFCSSPWLGIGPMHFGFYNFQIAAHPHNALLQVAAEYGLLAALLVTFLAVRMLSRAIHWCRLAQSNEDQHLNIALTASLVCGLTDSMFSGNTLMPQSQIVLFMVMGWLIGRNLHLRKISETNDGYRRSFFTCASHYSASHRWAQAAITIAVIVSTGIQINGIRTYYNFMTRHGFAMISNSHPRYWNDGHWPADRSLYQ